MPSYHITYDATLYAYIITSCEGYTLAFTETYTTYNVICTRRYYRKYGSPKIKVVQLANLLHDIMIDSGTSTFAHCSFWVMLRYNVTMSTDAIIAMLNSRKFIQP